MGNSANYISSHNKAGQSGNVLIFILIAVALLAALTMVLSRSGSSVDQSGNVEQNRISGSDLMRYGKSIETAIQQMKLSGISENELSFAHGSEYPNSNCTRSDCLLFDVGGAGLNYRTFPGANDGSDWIFTSDNNVGTTADPVGTTAARSGNDLIMLLPNVNSSLCNQINKDLSVGTTGTIPVDTTGIDTDEFDGSFASGGPVLLDGDPTPFELDGEPAGCFTDNDSGTTYFYYVVLTR